MYALEAQAMHGQFPMIWDKADNFQIFDKWGNVWIDFTSTIFVANAGMIAITLDINITIFFQVPE